MEEASKESSISEYLEDYHDLDVSYSKLFFKEKHTFTNGDNDEEVIINNDSILRKYRKDLDDILISKTLTEDEQNRYFCNPWRLSHDLYGTVEFWFLILEANNLSSATEFTQNIIKVYDSSLPSVIDSIMSLEEDFINNNSEEVDNQNSTNSFDYLEDIDDEDEEDDNNIEEDDDDE